MLWDIRHEEEFSVAEKWIKDAIKKPGALRKAMGVKEGEKKLPADKRKMLQRVNLALTLRDMK